MAPSAGPTEAWLIRTDDGQRYEIEELEAMDHTLCVYLSLTDGNWTETRVEPMGLYEGVSSPYCDVDGVLGVFLDPTESGGGHGNFGSSEIDATLLSTAMTEASGEYTQWGMVDGNIAVHVEWLEGEFYNGPAFMLVSDGEDGEAFMPLAGFGDNTSIATSSADDLVLVCGTDRAGVCNSKGERTWFANVPCPMWWPPGR